MRFVEFTPKVISDLGRKAKEAMQQEKADHIVFGLRFGKRLLITGTLRVKDSEFQRRFATGRYDMVYAVHSNSRV